jgi:hypothetical protein
MATMVKDNPSVKYLGEAFLAAPKDVNSGL